MIDDQLDNETVAAFLDGTLPEAERGRVMRLLASSPEQAGNVLEAAKVAAELERVGQRPQLLKPKASRWQRRALITMPFLAAAGISGILILRRDNPPDVIALARAANLTTERGAGTIDRSLGATWDQPGWTVVRGGAPGAGSIGLTARVGARVAQLEFAAAAHDSAAYDRVASGLAEMLTSIEGAGPVAEQLRSGISSAEDAHATTVDRLRALSPATAAFDLGVWLETARLAARLGRVDFFASDGAALAALRSIRDRVARDGTLRDLRESLTHVEPLLQPGGSASPDPTVVFARVDSAMSVLPR